MLRQPSIELSVPFNSFVQLARAHRVKCVQFVLP